MFPFFFDDQALLLPANSFELCFQSSIQLQLIHSIFFTQIRALFPFDGNQYIIFVLKFDRSFFLCYIFIGRKPKFEKEKKQKIFESEKQNLVKNGKIPIPSDLIWIHLKSKYELRADVTPKAIYTAALEYYKENKVIIPNENDDGSNKSGDENDEIKSNKSTDSNESSQLHDSNTVRFDITVSSKAWNYIKPECEEYHREPDTDHKTYTRKYSVLKRGSWTCALSEQIARNRNDIPCKWVYKRGKVYENSDVYIKVSGSCVTCDAKLVGVLKKKPESPTKLIKFQFVITDLNMELHSKSTSQKSVRVGGDYAHDIYKGDKVSIMKRRRAISQATSLCEYPKERVPTSAAIRSGKYRLRKFDRIDECPILSIDFLKRSTFGSCIRFISYNPFYAIYISVDQLVMYNIYKKKKKFTKISCDSTASIAHKIRKHLKF